MKIRKAFLWSAIIILLLLCLYWKWPSSKSEILPIARRNAILPPSETPKEKKRREEKEEEYSYPSVVQVATMGGNNNNEAWYEGMKKIYNAPIDFWGKVVDERGQPIADAKINYNIADKPGFDVKGSKMEGKSDADGNFSLLGKKGAFLQVFVSKDGYYGKGGDSTRTLDYGLRGRPGVQLPTADNPAVFILRKKGEGAALIRIQNRSYPINGNGTPVEVNLESGKAVATNQGDLKIEYWALSAKNEKKHFDWKCRISVPGGGLVPWKGEQEFDFEAPEDGYQPSVEIDMPASMERWNDDQSRKFFVKTSDGKYARIEFGMVAADEPFFVLKGFYNPYGSRNLEYDPEKEIKLTNGQSK